MTDVSFRIESTTSKTGSSPCSKQIHGKLVGKATNKSDYLRGEVKYVISDPIERTTLDDLKRTVSPMKRGEGKYLSDKVVGSIGAVRPSKRLRRVMNGKFQSET